ncbi:hypothetical protein KUCAC02_014192 [Chaenocephalus aceratus]|uniref:Uncharacterized protein n=1 Tax=Chaenocephalus aceratus TaxID=36190 RepID=A0ACB9WDQ7_CHAAC|nr:hypothetical protein KUCAC02_014192 [Chaenocephalus aceratus]
MRRQKHLTVEEVHELIFNRVMEEKSTDEEDSGSEEEGTHEEGKCNKRRLFMEELGRQLVIPHIQRRKVLPRTPAAASLVMEVQQFCSSSTSAAATRHPARPAPARQAPPPDPSPKRSRCKFCPRQIDVKTKKICQRCNAYICKDHTIVTCPACN